MKRLFFIIIVLPVFYQPSFSQERTTLWGDFFFDMSRKEAISVLKQNCENIEYENNISVLIKADRCSFSDEPFQDKFTSVSLAFNHAFFRMNKRLRYVIFSFDDFKKVELARLYEYSENKWKVWRKWACSPRREISVIKATFQTCGGSFNEGRVHLRSNITHEHDENEDKNNPSKKRITEMHFYLDGSKLFGRNEPPIS